MVFFAMSLTPSLLPRDAAVQGLGSAVAFIVGYGIGTALFAVGTYLGIPEASGRLRVVIVVAVVVLIGFQTSVTIWAYVGWQNELRADFGMDPMSPLVWPIIVAVAAGVSLVLLAAARTVRRVARALARLLDRFLPRRLAITVGAVVVGAGLWWVMSGAFVNAFFTTANWAYSSLDRSDNPGVVQPTSELRSGGAASLVEWDELGRQGRSFVSGGAEEPVRVYVGLQSASTLQERADLLLAELQRAGAFERDVLVLGTTTGTGYLDPKGVDPVEYLHNGSTAIAGMQYSYLPSWISLLADQEVVRETSRVVFRTVHDHWQSLPDDDRPQIYLYGLSLGSTGVEAVLTSVDILNEPIDGALMSGPPFLNSLHRDITLAREPGTAPWQPVFSDGRTVRFTGEQYGLDRGGDTWGPKRIVYLQHGSDPVTFFDPNLAFEQPEWLSAGQSAPDVADRMEWYPIVTMWQVLLDMPAAGDVPPGHGHLFTHRSNLESWIGVMALEGWSEQQVGELAQFMERKSEDESPDILVD